MSFNGWIKTYIGSEIELIYGKSLPKTKRTEGEYPVYGSGGITGTHNEALVKGPGIIVGRKGTVGSLFYEKKDYFPIDTVYYIKESPKYDLKFIYYFLKTQSLDKMNSHSAVPGLNREEVYKKVISIPPLPEQKAIANILSSLDEKIELNNQMNKTLEEMAQALFKRWFVDFEFPNEDGEPYKSSGGEMVESELGMIPKGWSVKAFSELADSVSRKHDFNKQKLIFLNTSDVLEGEVLHSTYSDIVGLPGQAKKSISKDDILYSEIRPKNKRFAYIDFEAGDYVVSTKLMVLRAKGRISSKILYFYLTSNDTIDYLQMIAESRSGTFPQITFSELNKLQIAEPPQQLLNQLNGIFESVLNKIQENKRNSKNLKELRDTLLPKLMSGEIRVSNIQM